jgi:hypothetical protein
MISTLQIGDGKLPNKYWVSISNDYYYFNPEVHGYDWISDLKLFPVQSRTIAVFPTFDEAIKFIDNNLVLGGREDNINVNSISIEDRISGEVYHSTYEFYPPSGEISETGYTSTEFTEKKMREKGIVFA